MGEEGISRDPAPDSQEGPPFNRVGDMPEFSPSCPSLQAWTKARWLMRASTGMPQSAASVVVAVDELSWAAPSCHAVA